ncbi:NtaA/DmoA family FMN-dependent monooxygenase [Leucobacter sp. W1038]|uniref:NtaA/DmoA family FMN-dependent monooxygenase n=1 Tax=Leucobacter sp. W1038 TaxID=3438281 RepID=UPI003D979556
MHLIGWFAAGPIAYHQGGWRHPDSELGFFNAAQLAKWAKVLEDAKFDAVFFADGAEFDSDYAKRGHFHLLDLVPVASIIAHETSNLGIGITQNSSVNDAFNIARQVGTLDSISQGRIAWNVVTGQSPREAQKYGRELPSREDRYARATEMLEACSRLWGSTPESAVLLEKETGRFVDTDALDKFEYAGAHVQVVGPLPVAQSPQGRPVILQAGASPAGRKLAARFADVVFIMSRTAEQLKASAQTIRADAAAAERGGKVLVVPAVTVIVAESTEQARADWKAVNDLVDLDQAIDSASSLTGINLRDYPLNLPVADLPVPEQGSIGLIQLLKESAAETGSTLADAARSMTNSGVPLALGNPVEVADQLEALFAESTADGFMVHCPIMPAGFERFAETCSALSTSSPCRRPKSRGPPRRLPTPRPPPCA